MATSFSNDQGTGTVEADGFAGPNGAGLKFPNGMGSVSATTGNTDFSTLHGLPASLTAGTDTTPVITETYIGECWIDNNATLTGIAVLNGSAVAGNIKVGLFNSAGVLVAQSASTAQAGIATLQSLPFTTAYSAVGPAMYYVGLQCSSTSARFRSHPLGVSAAFKKTGETYGTFTTITPVTTFTADTAPIASTY